MAALTGTPTNVAFGAGINPAGQSITVPADALWVGMFWAYYVGSPTGSGLASVTLGGVSPTAVFEVPGTIDTTRSGLAYWNNPATGSLTLDPAWDTAPSDGPLCTVAYVTAANVAGAPRDIDGDNDANATAVTVTLTTVATDLVLKYDVRFSATSPALTAGFTAAQTQVNVNSLSSRLSTIAATGATQVCAAEGESFSTLVAVSIENAAGGATSLIIPRRGSRLFNQLIARD